MSIYVVAVVSLGVSCASDKSQPLALALESADGAPLSEREVELAATARKLIESSLKSTAAGRSKVISKKPYFYKEYAEYPQGVNSFETSVMEQNSRTSPYHGDVKIAKLRYATRLHRNRDEARDDDSFLRDTGVETISFEYRNDEWHRIGSLYVAEKSEQSLGGEWVPALESSPRASSVESSRKSLWDRIRFWR